MIRGEARPRTTTSSGWNFKAWWCGSSTTISMAGRQSYGQGEEFLFTLLFLFPSNRNYLWTFLQRGSSAKQLAWAWMARPKWSCMALVRERWWAWIWFTSKHSGSCRINLCILQLKSNLSRPWDKFSRTRLHHDFF